MKRQLFPLLAALLVLGSFAFFGECISYLARRDYVGAFLLGGIGLAVIHVGLELARLSLAERT